MNKIAEFQRIEDADLQHRHFVCIYRCLSFYLKFFKKVEGEHVSRELKNELGQRSRHCLTQLEVVSAKRIFVIREAPTNVVNLPGKSLSGFRILTSFHLFLWTSKLPKKSMGGNE